MLRGTVIASRYKLQKKLGVGGMGQVWAARHTTTERKVAIKLILPDTDGADIAKDRFLREARASARIGHPNVIDVFDAGELDDSTLFLAMELLEGVSLASAVRAHPPMSLRHYLVALADACRGLGAAHDVGIIHRDVKPANIFLHRDRGAELLRAVVLDFGISKFEDGGETTVDGTVLGSPRYMSPELLRGEDTDYSARSDIWSVGVMLFHALSGTWPHRGQGLTQLCVAIGSKPPANIDEVAGHVPPELRVLVKGCLAPADERYDDCSWLAEELEICAADPRMEELQVSSTLSDPSSRLMGHSLRVRDPWQSMAVPSWRSSNAGDRPSLPGGTSGAFGIYGVSGEHTIVEEDAAPTTFFKDGLPVMPEGDDTEVTSQRFSDLPFDTTETSVGESTAAPLAVSEPPRAAADEGDEVPTRRPWGLVALALLVAGGAVGVVVSTVGKEPSSPASASPGRVDGATPRGDLTIEDVQVVDARPSKGEDVAEDDEEALEPAASASADVEEEPTVAGGPWTPPVKPVPAPTGDERPTSEDNGADADPVQPPPPPPSRRPVPVPPPLPKPEPGLVGEDLGSGL